MKIVPSYRTTVIDSMAGMAGLAKHWNDLLGGSRSNTIFLTWEWLYTWVECFLKPDLRLFVILVHKEDELIGVAPWCIRHLRYGGCSMKRVEFLGIPETGSDYLDVIARQGKEKEVAHQIYHFLQNSTSRWDSLALQYISSESLFLLHFTAQIEEEGKYAELRYGPYCPSVSLPQTVEAFRSQLSANRRQQFSRHLRLLGREGEVRHRTHRTGEVLPSLKGFRKIYEQRWGSSPELFHFLDVFVARCEVRDWVQLDVLSVGERDVAGLLHFRYAGALSMYLMGVDHSFEKGISIGNLLVGLSIEQAIVAGLTKYDFLKGTEDYKFHWSNDGKREVSLYCYGRKLVPLMWMTGRFGKAIAKVLMR